MNSAFIIDALRTPVAKRNGALANWQAHHLAAALIRELVMRNNLDPDVIDEVVLGNAAGPGGNPARVALLEAGLPVGVPGVTVDRQCGGGLESIQYAARLVQSGAADCVLAGGVESVSTAPRRAHFKTGEFYERAAFTPDWMDDPDMGIAAENVAHAYGISRVQQDRFAHGSHIKAAAAEAGGMLSKERLAIPQEPPLSGRSHVTDEFIGNVTVAVDECVRPDCSLDVLASLPPVFDTAGTVTAGNACPLNDGAAVCLVVSESLLPQFTVKTCLRFIDACAAGVEPGLLGTGPIASTRKLMARNPGLRMDSVHSIEFNEAFAAQVLACTQALAIDHERLNRRGGAIALGHPFGASGAILVTRLFHQLQPDQSGLAMLGIGGGLGLSAFFEAV